MKKNYLLGAALMALTWTSCTQDDSLNLVGEDNSIFTGEMEFVGSRTSLGEDNKISWVQEDELSIFKKNNINRQYKVASIANGKATFSYLDNVTPATVEAITANYAVYPYNEDNSITADGTISAPIKAEYEFENRSSFISSALLAATSTGTNFSFKNVQGYLRLRLCAEIPDDYAAVESVTLTSTSKNLSGIAAITWSTDGIPSAAIKDEGAGHSLTVKLSTPQPLPSKASGDYLELYVPVVPMTFNPDEVSFTINFADDETYTKTNGVAITIARREVTGVKLTVGVDDNFTGDMEGFEEVWDGETQTVPAPVTDPATGEEYYPVVKPSELAGLAALINGTSRAAVDYSKIQIRLMNDIDLGGAEWEPIGLKGKRFSGIFNGNGYTIKNLKISKSNNGAQAALFGDVTGATIKNFTIDGAQILYPEGYTGDFYGAAVVSQAYKITLEDITVKNSTVQGNNKVAGILAHDADGAAMIIKNCHVLDSKIETKNETDGGNAGGIVGSVNGSENTKSLVNCSVKNTTFNVVNSANAGMRSNGQMVGTVIATAKTVLTLEYCVVEGNTFNQTGADTYKSCYDGVFVGGARNEERGTLIINGDYYYSTIPETIVLTNNTVTLKDITGNKGITVSGEGVLTLDGVAVETTEGAAITLGEGANVTFNITTNDATLTGATNGIMVPEGATLKIVGVDDPFDKDEEHDLKVVGSAGSGIGGDGTIILEGLDHVTAKGNGDHAFGIGGDNANVTIENSTVDYACGGHIQPLFVNDTKYGKSEPEGGAGIGGASIKIIGSTITKVDGGSKAAAIGAKYHQSTNIEITDSEIVEANGGNASAGIGGSRYASGISEENKQSVKIVIDGSTVTANGGQAGAGIGSGYDTHCAANDVNAVNDIVIKNSTVTAQGGKYAAGIGTGFHAAALTGSIDAASKVYATSGENFYKDVYSTAQNIGYGVVDPAREFKGAEVTFTVAGKLIEKPIEYPVAKVGNTEYTSIDEAIANWTNNTTLTLLDNLTLSDVVTLKSTEHHILNLSTYTMTAAEGKNAFEIKACGTGDAERYAITIKADATNPGGIDAGKKSIVYYKYADGGISGNDRPIIKIEGGVFTGSTASWGTAGIYTIGTAARQCATINISGGTFNCTIYGSTKSKLLISGGIFHYSVGSQGDSTANRLISGGTFKTLGFMTADSNNTKFWFGTSMGNSNVGLYINDDNYLVVGGPVITDFGGKFAAKATNPTKWSLYLAYSSAATNGLYYTNAEMAIKKHGEDNVVLP